MGGVRHPRCFLQSLLFNLASRTWPLGQVLEDMLVETDFDEKFYIIILNMIADPFKARSK